MSSEQPTVVLSRGVEVCTARGPIPGADEGQKVPPQPLLSCLGLLDRSRVLLEDPFLTVEEYLKRE